MKFKKADPKDEVQIKHLLETCDLPHEDITARYLNNFWVLKDDKEIVGVIGIEPFANFALLRSLAVFHRYRAKGIATQLTEKAEEHARSQKVEVLYLLTTTAEDFFKKRGYQITDRASAPSLIRETAEFQTLCPDSAVCMCKTLITKGDVHA
jgi:amino-acid N-acetyltransferase